MGGQHLLYPLLYSYIFGQGEAHPENATACSRAHFARACQSQAHQSYSVHLAPPQLFTTCLVRAMIASMWSQLVPLPVFTIQGMESFDLYIHLFFTLTQGRCNKCWRQVFMAKWKRFNTLWEALNFMWSRVLKNSYLLWS